MNTLTTIKRRLRFITGWLLIISAISMPIAIFRCIPWAVWGSATLLAIMIAYHVWEFVTDEREHQRKVSELKRTMSKARNGSLALIIMVLSSCAGTRSIDSCRTGYWMVKKNRGLETYTYASPGWPRDKRMATYYTGNPVKPSTVRRFKWFKPSKRR